MDKILSIDPSFSSTGFSVLTMDKKIIYFSKFQTKHDVEENQRIKAIVTILYSIAQTYQIKEVAMEDGFVGASMKTGLQLAKLRGGIITYFMMNNIPIFTQQPSETRKNLGLKGNAKKEDVANEILNLYPELINTIGPYSDKSNKQKTSDIYDSICIGVAHINKSRG